VIIRRHLIIEKNGFIPVENEFWSIIDEIVWGTKSTDYERLGQWLDEEYPTNKTTSLMKFYHY